MEKAYVDALRFGDKAKIRQLYTKLRHPFFGFALKYPLREEDLEDIYQDAFIAIRRQAFSGRLYQVKSSFKTYLFGIGKFMIFRKLKENSRNSDLAIPMMESMEDFKLDWEVHLTEEQELLNRSFAKLGKSCQQLLTLAFYRGLSNTEIAAITGMANEAVVRSQKSRCLSTLKELVAEYRKNKAV